MANYKRILLKLSGEALMGEKSFGLDNNVINQIALQIKKVLKLIRILIQKNINKTTLVSLPKTGFD